MTRLSYKGKEAYVESFSFGTNSPRDFYRFVCRGNLRRVILDLIKDSLNEDYNLFSVNNINFANNKLSDFSISATIYDFPKFELSKTIVKDNYNSKDLISFNEELSHIGVETDKLESLFGYYNISLFDKGGEFFKCKSFNITSREFTYDVPLFAEINTTLSQIKIVFYVTPSRTEICGTIIADLEYDDGNRFKVKSIAIE